MTQPNHHPPGLPVASTATIREDFPALQRLHQGYPVAYFDGPGGTQVPRAVADAVTDYLIHHNANTHWAFPTSIETDAALATARQTFADFLNASPSEIAFGPNMTTLTFHLARALGRSLGHGDAVVVTELDHHANIDPWRALERDRGITILQVKMIPETGQLDWDDLDRCLNDHRCRLLAIGAASNALGTINDIPRAVAMAREAEALTFVDAVHYAPIRSWMSRHGDATSWPARPTSFTGRMSASSMGSANGSRHWTSPSSSPHRIMRPSGSRRVRRTMKGSSAPRRR